MNHLHTLLAAGLLLAGCGSSRDTASRFPEDDVYYQPNTRVVNTSGVNQTPAGTNEPNRNVNEGNTQSGDTYITNNNYTTTNTFDADDYYDYSYAARLRRFHSGNAYFGYYDPYFTNSYWYSGNPYGYGTSIYMGYHWWGPSYYAYSYYPGSSWGWGWGIGGGFYDPWFPGYSYNPWGYGYGSPYGWNPYYGGGWRYRQGYWRGYRDGYADGYGDSYYYNSYDPNSYHYGPRQLVTGGNSRKGAQPSFQQRMQQTVGMNSPLQSQVTPVRTENAPYKNLNTVQPTAKPGSVNPNTNSGLKDIPQVNPAVRPETTQPLEPGRKPVNVKDYQFETQPTQQVRPEPNPARPTINKPELQPTQQARPEPAPARPTPNKPEFQQAQPNLKPVEQFDNNAQPNNEARPEMQRPTQPANEQPNARPSNPETRPRQFNSPQAQPEYRPAPQQRNYNSAPRPQAEPRVAPERPRSNFNEARPQGRPQPSAPRPRR